MFNYKTVKRVYHKTNINLTIKFFVGIPHNRYYETFILFY